MIVVSDSTVLMGLAKIRELDLPRGLPVRIVTQVLKPPFPLYPCKTRCDVYFAGRNTGGNADVQKSPYSVINGSSAVVVGLRFILLLIAFGRLWL